MIRDGPCQREAPQATGSRKVTQARDSMGRRDGRMARDGRKVTRKRGDVGKPPPAATAA